ncbi:nucleotide disphospho-sugar-binding domain-containing protein [Streptomyces sp. TLI_185]|uniref:nucleotide disphospho-sugar-binding domain-containing protein n=1 Tax=Streptomyces sp. TLI_185 TaxID=2485151 RepID=UPI000F4DE3A8|nr:nucleotide disphospho-sugar-binding domain-containing protein [Streptomyces sp. TLI_185]RPF24899.1 8-demethyltetracenomycin C L-rhamnosyltransferase [Streptomyces sp. TLI_185]
MRVMVVATPALGHLFPAVPLLWALRALGDEILVVTAGDATRVSEAGLPVIDALPGETLTTLFDDFQAIDAAFFAGLSRRPMESMADLTPVLAHVAARLLEPTRAVAGRWRPDAVLTTHGQGAGRAVAAELDIPLIEHGLGFARSNGIQEAVRTVLAEQFGSSGVPPTSLFVDIAVPSMTTVPEGMTMRSVPYNGGALVPDAALTTTGRPRVLVTAGTQLLRSHGVDALAWLPEVATASDTDFLLAAGDADLSALGALPPNVRTLEWTPLSILLPTCSAVVHHGGSGTTMSALAAGVPQLVMPALADNHINARAVEERGVGISTHEAAGTALASVLSEPAFSKAARDVAAEIHSLPPPATVAARLHDVWGHPTTYGEA